MKNRKKCSLVFLLAVFFAVASLSGCDKEKTDNNVINDFYKKLEIVASQGINHQHSISDCISEKIEEIETSNAEDSAIIKVQIFEGVWEDNVFYLIKNNLNSCVLCEIYSNNCEKITLEEYQIENFCLLSKNWKLIYEYGNGIF